MSLVKAPLYFVIHLDRIDSDIARVSNLMSTRYQRDLAVDGKFLLTHNLELEARLLQQFKFLLKRQISRYAPVGSIDSFGNSYLGFDVYSYIEMQVSYDYKTFSVRFLGNVGDKEVRFSAFGIPNTLDPTTLNIVSEIRQLSDSIEDFFSKISILFTCRPGSWIEDGQIINDIGEMTSGALDAQVMSRISYQEFLKTYFVPDPVFISRTVLTDEDVEAVKNKYDGKLFKNIDDIRKEGDAFYNLKSGISRLAKEGIEVNASSKVAFFTDIDKQLETCSALFSSIFDKFTLGCLIQEALKCVRPGLTCKEILRGLSVDNLRERISLAFPFAPQTVEQINKIILEQEKEEQEQLSRQREAEQTGGKIASVTTPGERRRAF